MNRIVKAEGPGASAWRRLLALAALAGAVSLPLLSASAEHRTLRLQPRGPYAPGTRVTITWDALPPGTEEFELLLRCKLPAPLKFRLTECVEPDVQSLDWTVANIPCQAAAIVLRFGLGGREMTWGRSEPFLIRADARAPVPSMILSRGELWVGRGAAPRSLETGEGGCWAAPSGFPIAAESTLDSSPTSCRSAGGVPGRDTRADSEAPKILSRLDRTGTPQRPPLRI